MAEIFPVIVFVPVVLIVIVFVPATSDFDALEEILPVIVVFPFPVEMLMVLLPPFVEIFPAIVLVVVESIVISLIAPLEEDAEICPVIEALVPDIVIVLVPPEASMAFPPPLFVIEFVPVESVMVFDPDPAVMEPWIVSPDELSLEVIILLEALPPFQFDVIFPVIVLLLPAVKMISFCAAILLYGVAEISPVMLFVSVELKVILLVLEVPNPLPFAEISPPMLEVPLPLKTIVLSPPSPFTLPVIVLVFPESVIVLLPPVVVIVPRVVAAPEVMILSP